MHIFLTENFEARIFKARQLENDFGFNFNWQK